MALKTFYLHSKAALAALFIAASTAPCVASGGAQAPYSVVVSIADQRTYVYRGGALVRAMLCSTGLVDGDDDTPLGDYVIDESGKKRGRWFYSAKYKEGAKYWVGFIGGTYLFHSVPMDKDGRIIPAEAAKLGRPASHGCVRLSVDDAYWFYRSIPSGSRLRVIAGSLGPGGASGSVPTARATAATSVAGTTAGRREAALGKAEVPAWLADRFGGYRQKYPLSCEIALTRMSLALLGVETGEDEILSTIPRSGDDPERAFVCDDIRGGRRLNGKILWNNYGTHPPVVVAEIERRLRAAGLADSYEALEISADDAALRSLIEKDPNFLGAVLWLVGHPERWGERPPVNERGMVLGEHVRFLEPRLAEDGEFRIWDPENGKLIVSRSSGAARELFHYRIVALYSKR